MEKLLPKFTIDDIGVAMAVTVDTAVKTRSFTKANGTRLYARLSRHLYILPEN